MTAPGGTTDGAAGAPAARARRRPSARRSAPVPEQPSAAPAPAAPRRRGGAGRLVLGVLAAVALAAVLLAGLLLLRQPSEGELRDSAVLAARTYTTSLTTFDARTYDADVERVRGAATGEFATQYDETVAALRESVLAQQTASTGTVVGAGVEQLEGDTATVIVAVDQQITSAGAEPRTEANRLRMTLERRDDSWVVSKVERL